MKLASCLSDAGGAYNEDTYGFVEKDGEVTAAWALDGVTGINDRNILPAVTDAIWFVERVQTHLQDLAAPTLPLPELLDQLTARLIADWSEATNKLGVPANYDLPACCLLLVQKFDDGWRALRLGDSFLLTRQQNKLFHHVIPSSNLDELDREQKAEAQKRRSAGNYDFKALLAEFRPRMLANRLTRNKPGGVSVLEPTRMSLEIPQFIELGTPSDILLCTDGFYRCVDHYGLHDDESLMEYCRSQSGAEAVLRSMRGIESDDPDCTKFLRFKPRDDATVLMLSQN